MRHFILTIALFGAALTASAQVLSRPTDPPLVTAANDSWYVMREPITIAGEVYYPAGPMVFFNGNTMVRSGHYNGVPVYSDTTLEPFSVFLVPVTRGMLQPYERPRSGTLAGTTGSRTPSFPVRMTPEVAASPRGSGHGVAAPPPLAMAPVSPTAPPQPAGAISVFTPEPAGRAPAPVGTSGVVARPLAPMVTLLRPQSNDGLWIQFQGQRWINRGRAVPLDSASFSRIGDHAGFSVYVRTGEPDVIYLPTRADLVAPYRLR